MDDQLSLNKLGARELTGPLDNLGPKPKKIRPEMSLRLMVYPDDETVLDLCNDSFCSGTFSNL